jgi:uncharacterized protein YhbP (UPF0306 family)
MLITRSMRTVSRRRIVRVGRRLLDASSLCAISTVSPGGRAHVNTAYFAWSSGFDLVWLSDPGARHSRNLRSNRSAAIAVYESDQGWGQADRGIQLLGTAREASGSSAEDARRLYSRRFPASAETDLGAYRFYRFRARRLKLFDEADLGAGVFVTARIDAERRVTWERTEVYRAAP